MPALRDPDARLAALRWRQPKGNDARGWWLGMLCPWHIANVRSKTRTLRVVSVA